MLLSGEFMFKVIIDKDLLVPFLNDFFHYTTAIFSVF